MTNPHALIAAALREHRFERCSISEPGCFIWWGRCTGCGVESDRRTSNYGWELDMRDDEERHQTEQLLSLPGVAIVEVPDPDGSRWVVDEADDDFHVSTMELLRIQDGAPELACRVSWGEIDLGLTVPVARALAAALLAAANKAAEAGK